MNKEKASSESKGSKATTRYPRLLPEPAIGEPWKPVMTEQQRKEHEQYVKEHHLPF